MHTEVPDDDRRRKRPERCVPLAPGRQAIIFAVLTLVASRAFADHVNLESDIPTTIDDIEPTDFGSVELQGFGRYLRLRGQKNVGEAEPRLAWGVAEDTQLRIGTPLLLQKPAASGNGDVRLSALRKLLSDRKSAWWPGAAVEAEFRLPTGSEARGFENRLDAGLTAIAKKDVGPHSFHLNAGFNWTGDRSEKEDLRSLAWNIVVGHDMPLTEWLLLVSDAVWQQADDEQTTDIWLYEIGVRAQLTRSLIGAIGIGVGLNGGQETPVGSLTAGFQFSVDVLGGTKEKS